MADIQLATQSYRSASKRLSTQRLLNAYAEAQPGDAKSPVAVFGAPGVDDFVTCGSGPIRGGFEVGGVAYVVSGQSFYSFDATGTATLLGAGITGAGPVSIEGNGFEIVIVNGSAGWVYTTGTGIFAQITDADFNAANTVTFLNGYFIFDHVGTNQFFLSDLYDGEAYSALDFASAESSPDGVLSVCANQSVLILFGEKTSELWSHTGALSFPFQPYTGSTIARGIAAPLAFAKEDNVVFFLGEDRRFYRLVGNQPVRVSTHALEAEWERYGVIDDAFCFTFGAGGHKFIVLKFPTAETVFVCDVTTGFRWHERVSYDASGSEPPWRVNAAFTAYGYTFLGDANSGKVGKVNPTTYTEFGDVLPMTMVFPTIHGDGKRVFMPEFEIEVETGVGLASGQGEDPQYMLDYSDDGGRTWSAAQTWRSAGKIGETRKRLRWNRLGSFYERTMRLQITDPVQRAVIKARCPGIYTGV